MSEKKPRVEVEVKATDEATKAPAVADDVLPDTLYLMPIPNRPFFPGQVQPVAINPQEWGETIKAVEKDGRKLIGLSYVDRAKLNLARVHAVGVPISLGTDTNNPYVFPGCSVHVEMELLGQSGLSNADVLRIATLGSAELLGVEDELGKVAPGYVANLIILDENPLEDLRNTWSIDKVVLKGRVIELPVESVH